MRTDRTLSIRQLSHRFGERVALDDVEFDVRPGRLTGFVGANGAGKTTAMRAVMGILTPDAGTVTFGGEPLTLERRRRVGYMPEERGLYPKMKVHDQLVFLGRMLGLSKGVAAERASSLLDDFDLSDRADEQLHTLSLGNQQRVQVAAAVIHDPDLLVLDEPFSGLDPLAMDAMSARLRERAEVGVPVLFSSHQLDLVERLCDDLVLIHGGRIVAAGSKDEIREARSGRQYRVGVDGVPQWRPDLHGVTVVTADDRQTVVELEDDVDPQALLKEALAHGPVAEFGRVVPSLAQIFNEVAR